MIANRPDRVGHEAQVELRGLSHPCRDRRLADLETLQQEIQTWELERNAQPMGVDWRFPTEDARIWRKRLYPQYQS